MPAPLLTCEAVLAEACFLAQKMLGTRQSVYDFVATGELVRVLPEWKAPHGIFHAVYPSRRGLLPAVRVFIDYLVKHLSKC